MTESHQDMQRRVFSELLAHIGEGPYLGGLEGPTMLVKTLAEGLA